jgi:hypothetical protein
MVQIKYIPAAVRLASSLAPAPITIGVEQSLYQHIIAELLQRISD